MRRRKIRDIDSMFHCSIIGTCLGFGEVRALLEESYSEDLSSCSDYILHGMAVSGAGGISRFSNRLTEKLNSKYRIDVHQSNNIDNYIALQRFWDASYNEGNIAGPYWAVLSHPECTEDLRNQAFGEVHMLSHLAGKEERGTLTEIRNLKDELSKLKSKYEDDRSKRFSLSEENKSLRLENRRLSDRLEESIEEKRKTSEASSIVNYEAIVEKLKGKLKIAEQRNSHLEGRLNEAGEEMEALREYNELIIGLSKSAGDALESGYDICKAESALNLNGKRVLLVGGRLSMVPHCKSVVESMEGEFLYHDGGKEQSRLTLRSLAFSSDIVICALDCVSHDATRCVKKICSGGRQKIIMIKNSGLSTFTKELRKAV
ncbi:MAG: DUF2325 domain-containing protein [Spirochaetales bacterium]|nr:DUF2325 domain-containing protein [Spirochaetales bacterium]